MLKLNYDNVDSPLKPWGFFSTTDCCAQPSYTWGLWVQRLKHPMEAQVLSSSEQWSPALGILHDFLSLSPSTKPKSRIFTLSDSDPYGIVCSRELLPKSSGTLETRKRSLFSLEFSFSPKGSPSCLHQGSDRGQRHTSSWERGKELMELKVLTCSCPLVGHIDFGSQRTMCPLCLGWERGRPQSEPKDTCLLTFKCFWVKIHLVSAVGQQ